MRNFWLVAFAFFALATSAIRAADAVVENPTEGRERFSFGYNVGASLPAWISGATYSAFPTAGLLFEFKPIRYLSVGISSQITILLNTGNTGYDVVESAWLPQVLFHLGETGFYAGLRAGLNVEQYEPTYSTSTLVGFVWGPKVGYQYHFKNSRLALGPEWNMLFMSSASTSYSSSSSSSTVTVPAHNTTNLVMVMKWWF